MLEIFLNYFQTTHKTLTFPQAQETIKYLRIKKMV